jgi:hypothetical protein
MLRDTDAFTGIAAASNDVKALPPWATKEIAAVAAAALALYVATGELPAGIYALGLAGRRLDCRDKWCCDDAQHAFFVVARHPGP